MAVETAEDNSILLRIEQFSQLTPEGIYSEKKHYRGFPWTLRAYKSALGGLAAVLYIFKEQESNVWFCDASMEIFLINQNEGGEDQKIHSTAKHRFSPKNCNEGANVIFEKSRLYEDPSMGFIKNETVIVEARITVHGKDGNRFRKKVEYDMFSPSPKSDGILVVQGKKLYVSKQFLSTQSAFFDRLFFGKFKESMEEESEIQEVILHEFTVLLKMLYRTGEPFTDDNVEFVLRLADRFEMMSILDDAENHLMNSKGPSIHTKLRLADQYNLFVLHDHLLPKYTAHLIRELNTSPDFGMLKEETKDALFKIYIDLTSRRY